MRGTSYTPQGRLVDAHLAQSMTSYSHSTRANGGWWAASLQFAATPREIEEWYEDGVGRHIEVYSPDGLLVWAGFVDQVAVEYGTLSATVGPLTEVANRTSVVYTPILDPSDLLVGAQTVTTVADDEDSQELYGILEESLSGGELLDDGVTDDAAQYRDTYLAEHRIPAANNALTVPAGRRGTVSLELKGYVHFLMRYVTETLTEASCSILTKIQDALGDDPNGLFSTDYSQMDANPYLVSRYEAKQRTAWAVIEEMIELGDADDDRYTFGVYGEQTVRYEEVGADVAYQHRLNQPTMRIERFGTGERVEPWEVEAGKWLFLPDWLAGKGTDVSRLRDDHRYILIEQVNFRAPDQVEINGGQFGTLAQWLAKRGLGS